MKPNKITSKERASSQTAISYKILLLKNINKSYDKGLYQDTTKELGKFFELNTTEEDPHAKLFQSIIYNLLVSYLYFKKNETKKFFFNLQECLGKVSELKKLELHPESIQDLYKRYIVEDEGINQLIKKIVIRDLEFYLKKYPIARDLKLESISKIGFKWFSEAHYVGLYFGILFCIFILFKHPPLNGSMKINLSNFIETLKGLICKEETCSKKYLFRNMSIQLNHDHHI